MLVRSDVITALGLTLGIGLAAQASAVRPGVESDPATGSHRDVSLTNDVMPIFENRCWQCHGEESTEAGLRLDSYDGIMVGSEYGTVIEPGDPGNSVLIDEIESGDMPDEGDPVLPEELDLIKAWITEGAQNN